VTDQPTLGCTLQDDEPGKCCQFRRPCPYAYPLGWPHHEPTDLAHHEARNLVYAYQRENYAAALQATKVAPTTTVLVA
jgi:hypothetical protein